MRNQFIISTFFDVCFTIENKDANLNQLTKLAHQGRIFAVDLSELLSVYRQILVALGGENDGGN